MSKKFSATIALTLIIFVSFLGAIEASKPGKDFNIPPQLGIVKESFQAGGTEQNAGRAIIHIQDAHCNYEAQKNMAGILEYLVKEQNLKLIMIEGGSGNVSLSFLRGYADEKARLEVADKYLKEGKISGEEYLDIISDYPLELYGIEDEALYDAHLSSFQQIDAIKDAALRDLEGLSRVVENLKPFIYSEDLRRLEDKQKKYAEKTLSLAQYCSFLKEIFQNKGLNLQDAPHLTAFVETARLEKEIDFAQAELERNNFIKDLANLLDENSVQELISQSQDFKAKKITSSEYYSFLKETGSQKLDLAQNYPQLYAYIEYLNISKDIDAAQLLKEVGLAEEKLKDASFTTPEQKRLAEISQAIQILTRILNLELTPEDYVYFKANKTNFLTASWIEFLTENCRRFNLSNEPAAAQTVDANLEQLDGFYQLGVAREKAFMDNLVNKMNDSGENLGVLITGGFHTPGVTQMLKEKGYSYVVVAPVITQKSDPNVYFSVLRGEKNHLAEAIKEE